MFLDGLPRASHYWGARSKDVDAYRLTRGHRIKRKAPPPEAHEFSPELEALAAVFLQLQQLCFLVGRLPVPKKGRKRRFKPVKWPIPETAADLVQRQERREALAHFEDVIRFVPDDEWIAQHGPPEHN